MSAWSSGAVLLWEGNRVLYVCSTLTVRGLHSLPHQFWSDDRTVRLCSLGVRWWLTGKGMMGRDDMSWRRVIC